MSGAGSRGVSSAATWGECRPRGLAGVLVWLSRRTPLGRGTTRRLVYSGFRALHPGPADTLLFGARMRLHHAMNVAERKALMRPDRMDPKEHALVARRMREDGAVFVDVGANAGLYSLDAALHAGKGARILAVEPNAALIERLEFNLALACADGLIRDDVAVKIHAVAVSDREGTGILAGNTDEGGRSLEGAGADADGLEVRLRPLVALAAEEGLTRIDVMKIDVEGHEDKVLPPFLASAPRALWPRLIVIEHLARGSWAVDCIADAETKGYRMLFKTQNNSVLELADAR